MSTKPVQSPYRHFGCQAWPVPGEALRSLEWSLRYGDGALSETERLLAASVVDAYQELVANPTTIRNAIIQELRKGPGITE